MKMPNTGAFLSVATLGSCLIATYWILIDNEQTQTNRGLNFLEIFNKRENQQIKVDGEPYVPSFHSKHSQSLKETLQSILHQRYSLESDKNIYVPDCKTTKLLVYKCTVGQCGGLGDRMKGILCTFLLALITNRTFAMVYNRPCALTDMLEPNLYDWAQCGGYLNDTAITGESKSINFMDGRFHKLETAQDFSSLFRERVVFFKINNIKIIHALKKNPQAIKLLPFLRELSLDEICSQLLPLLIKPALKMTSAVSNIVAAAKDGNKKLVCAHIRMGKNPTIPKDNVRKGGTPNIDDIFQFLDNFNESANYMLFIPTDSQEVRHQVAERYKRVISTSGPIVHIDRFSFDGTECDGQFKAYLEFEVLIHCDVLLLTRSNFGAFAAYIRASSMNLFCYTASSRTIVPCRYDDLNVFYRFG